MSLITRRRALLAGGAGLATLGIGGCAMLARGTVVTPEAVPGIAPPLTQQISQRMKLHMFQTGWVAVKQEHRAFDGPASLRLPAIMASGSWTEWLPITAFAIEHPGGLYLVDTGETTRISDPDYTTCDPVSGLFYRRNLQFAVKPEQELAAQMAQVGLAPDRVRQVIMTHLHSDHMGGMAAFPNAEFLVSEAARGGHTGALMCRIPSALNIQSVVMQEQQTGVFARSFPVTKDGAIKIVPTPGHALGHQSVLLSDDGVSLCLAGDAAFTLGQIKDQQMAGIVESAPDARGSLGALRDQMRAFQTVMLPTHDPENAARLAAL